MRFARLAVLSTLAFALLAAPLAAEAHSTEKVYRIGILYAASPEFNPNADPADRAIVNGLREHGYVVGQNLVIEFRTVVGKRERLPEPAVELVKIPVDLILVPGVSHARAAKQATEVIQ